VETSCANIFFSIFDPTPCARGAKKEKTLWQPTVRKRSLEKKHNKKRENEPRATVGGIGSKRALFKFAARML
jgi:hypothetical protein